MVSFDAEFRIPQAPALAGERVAFTGTLASMTHKQAQARVAESGGTATDHVSRQTTMLVVGEEGWPLEPDGAASVKLLQVERWRNEGLDIRIVREAEWLGFVGLDAHRRDVERLYTPAMLSQMLGIPVTTIRRWERLRLIKPVSRVFRLPFFDVREVAGARRLSELVEAGVSIAEIQSGLDQLQHWLGGIERPLAQLEILARDQEVLYRDAHGRLKTVAGQRLFDFDGPAIDAALPASVPFVTSEPDRGHWKAHDWFEEGRRLAEEGTLAAAVEAYRLSLMDDYDAPEVQFHLAETLYRLENPRGALERYHIAAELDHNYLEAWTQIGCLHAELGELDSAGDAFRVALDVHPDYPDAHLHLAEVLHQSGRTAEAIAHWRKYLEFNSRGPWAEAARGRLDEVGANSAAP
ncbi:MAG: tetratricopeptide repeat protein [Planctomycetaceae bacterium]|nr:tetratricopeptide repeat protein [Planctomycetaceae bacterium]